MKSFVPVRYPTDDKKQIGRSIHTSFWYRYPQMSTADWLASTMATEQSDGEEMSGNNLLNPDDASQRKVMFHTG